MSKVYAYNPFTDELDIVSQSLTLTGTVNGTNRTFTCPIRPSFVNVDGLIYPNQSDSTPTEAYWSWSGGTLTIEEVITPVFFLRAIL